LVDIEIRVQQESDEPSIAPQEKTLIRAELVKAMVSLSSPSDKLLRAQIGEAVGLVAAVDFPDRWQDLVDVSHTQTRTFLPFHNSPVSLFSNS
jgi:exportin-2 (importin alpha re-exporter)